MLANLAKAYLLLAIAKTASRPGGDTVPPCLHLCGCSRVQDRKRGTRRLPI